MKDLILLGSIGIVTFVWFFIIVNILTRYRTKKSELHKFEEFIESLLYALSQNKSSTATIYIVSGEQKPNFYAQLIPRIKRFLENSDKKAKVVFIAGSRIMIKDWKKPLTKIHPSFELISNKSLRGNVDFFLTDYDFSSQDPNRIPYHFVYSPQCSFGIAELPHNELDYTPNWKFENNEGYSEFFENWCKILIKEYKCRSLFFNDKDELCEVPFNDQLLPTSNDPKVVNSDSEKRRIFFKKNFRPLLYSWRSSDLQDQIRLHIRKTGLTLMKWQERNYTSIISSNDLLNIKKHESISSN